MTLGAWLRDRTPTPPPRLSDHIEDVLGDLAARDEREAPVLCVDAAERLLRELLDKPTGRASALDLLTVDALVTYAFEAAAREPSSLDAHAERAMARLSLVSE